MKKDDPWHEMMEPIEKKFCKYVTLKYFKGITQEEKRDRRKETNKKYYMKKKTKLSK